MRTEPPQTIGYGDFAILICLIIILLLLLVIIFYIYSLYFSEEWRWLVNEKLQVNSLWLTQLPRRPTGVQQDFETELQSACDRLLAEIGDRVVDKDDDGVGGDRARSGDGGCRLYDVEVLELNADVSFVVVLPPSERVCDSPLDECGSRSHRSLPDAFSCLPVQAFELREYAYLRCIHTFIY